MSKKYAINEAVQVDRPTSCSLVPTLSLLREVEGLLLQLLPSKQLSPWRGSTASQLDAAAFAGHHS